MHLTPPTRLLLVPALAAIAALAAAAGGRAQAPAGTTAFEGARVIVGDGRAPIENAFIVVTDGRFARVGPVGKVAVSTGAARVTFPARR